MIKSSLIVLMSGTACILIGIGLLGNQAIFGSLIGYWVGLVYALWIYSESQRGAELEIHLVLKRMRWNMVARFSMVTLVVVLVARFQASWLLSLAAGIALGVMVSFITVAIHILHGERGDKRSA